MAIEDLDLEFEDEEESEKSDALSVDIDLSFSASAEPKSTKVSNKVVGNATSMSADDATDPNVNIKLPKTQSPQVKTTTAATAKPTAKPTQMPPAKAAAVRSNAVNPQNRPQAANVSNIADHPARASQQAAPTTSHTTSQVTPQAKVVDQSFPQTQVTEDYHNELELLRSEIAEMKKQMQEIKNQADVKVAVAEAKTEFMLDYISDAKLMEHQLNQTLQRIYQKAPALKTEVVGAKKFLAEFIEKTTKKK